VGQESRSNGDGRLQCGLPRSTETDGGKWAEIDGGEAEMHLRGTHLIWVMYRESVNREGNGSSENAGGGKGGVVHSQRYYRAKCVMTEGQKSHYKENKS